MKNQDIIIRDPFILLVGDTYYMYGSNSLTLWEPGEESFYCYKSRDLENWEGPIEIFHKPEGFFADRNYWAPECIAYKGNYYLITTFASADTKKGIYILKADHPEGPFLPYSSRLTPEDWTCIDGTVYVDGERIFLVYSHSFEDSPTGDMCCQELSADLTHSLTDPSPVLGAGSSLGASGPLCQNGIRDGRRRLFYRRAVPVPKGREAVYDLVQLGYQRVRRRSGSFRKRNRAGTMDPA